MLSQEFGRLKAIFDPGVGICTLKLTKQKLPAACQMLGVEPPNHHRALADARASAAILKALKVQCGGQSLKLASVPGEISVRTHRRCADESTLVFDRLLSRVVYTEGDTRLLQYMDLLDWVLDDLVLTSDERQHLNFLAEELSLTEAEITSAHQQYFEAMVIGANKDGVITAEENAALTFVAKALGIQSDRVPAITEPDCGCGDIPDGSAICFTGSIVDACGNKLSKADLEKLATNCGFTVVSTVTKSKCDLVVAVDPSSASGKAKKAREFGKPVIASQEFLKLVQK